jgi:hypothetical protein
MVPYSKAHSKGKVHKNRQNRLETFFQLLTQSGLDEWHLPICYQNPPFSWENTCTKSGMCCFSVVPLIENSDGCQSFLCLVFASITFSRSSSVGMGAHCTSCYVAVVFFLVLQNRTIGFEIKSL